MKVHTYAEWQARRERDKAWTDVVDAAFARLAPLAVSEEAPAAHRTEELSECAPDGEEKA